MSAAAAEDRCRRCGCSWFNPCDNGFGEGCYWAVKPVRGLGTCSCCVGRPTPPVTRRAIGSARFACRPA